MDELSTPKSQGVASLFEKGELKRFFKTYLCILLALEILIFFIGLLCQLEPVHTPFPWRYYLLASFLTPIVITFLLAVIVMAFNLFFFGRTSPVEESSAPVGAEKHEKIPPTRLSSFRRFSNQVPFLFTLLLLVIGAVVFSRSDPIMTFVGAFGERALVYGLITFGVLKFIATAPLFNK